MTIATWLAEYYPEPAASCPADQAVAHSLRKWKGLRREVLEGHGLRSNYGDVTEDGHVVFLVNSSTCSLCANFYNDASDDGELTLTEVQRCSACPLAISRGGVPCTRRTEGEQLSPWAAWAGSFGLLDPEPMIAALEAASEGKS